MRRRRQHSRDALRRGRHYRQSVTESLAAILEEVLLVVHHHAARCCAAGPMQSQRLACLARAGHLTVPRRASRLFGGRPVVGIRDRFLPQRGCYGVQFIFAEPVLCADDLAAGVQQKQCWHCYGVICPGNGEVLVNGHWESDGHLFNKVARQGIRILGNADYGNGLLRESVEVGDRQPAGGTVRLKENQECRPSFREAERRLRGPLSRLDHCGLPLYRPCVRLRVFSIHRSARGFAQASA